MPVDYSLILAGLKAAQEFFKRTKDAERAGQMLELYRVTFEAEEETRGLRRRVEELEQHQVDRERLEFRDNSLWDKTSGEGPFCSPCFQTRKGLIRLHVVGDGAYHCPVCNTPVRSEAWRRAEEAAAKAQNERARGGSWIESRF